MKIAYKLRSFVLFFVLLNISFLLDFNDICAYSVNNDQKSLDPKAINSNLNTTFTSEFCWFAEQETLNGSLFYSTIYGDFIVDDPLIIELIKSPEMQRLKKINQYGIDYFVYKPEEYTRFQHSICVYLLTKKYGASIKEQVAALLHDVSHTVFSHSGDFLLKEDCRVDSYQDDIHDFFLQNSSIRKILDKYNLTTKDVLHKNAEFKILDQPVPELCADRIEYNLYGGCVEGILTPSQVKTILADLKYENGLWYFDSISSARLLAYFALFLTDTRLAGFDNFARNSLFGKILERALEMNIISLEDIHSSTDDAVWNRLTSCNDSLISPKLLKLSDIGKFYELDKQQYDICYYPKFRAIDPLIKMETGFFRLTELNQAFKDDYEALKARIAEGVYIKFKD